MNNNPQQVQLDANEIITNLSLQIADLSKENAVLKAHIKALQVALEHSDKNEEKK